ncbi:hypothetical protein Tsp_08441 [Trichinella spiralis]|uniref:hypothetical protein n=1 Tax=Trichinella spiralis TaxID=6334 RepID=UPI0001EFB776|nr:hypothetical protein Tsp_08441 [Trichinella spiralis]
MHSFKFIGIRVEACLGERISSSEKSKTLAYISWHVEIVRTECKQQHIVVENVLPFNLNDMHTKFGKKIFEEIKMTNNCNCITWLYKAAAGGGGTLTTLTRNRRRRPAAGRNNDRIRAQLSRNPKREVEACWTCNGRRIFSHNNDNDVVDG